MNGHYTYLSILVCIAFFGGGCEVPQETPPADYSDIQGITLADLQAKQQPTQAEELLLSFSVLTYVLDTDSLASLDPIIDSLSQQNFHYDNADAFEANGFSIGLGSHQEGASIAQKLQSIGAVRASQGSLVIPPHSHEILSGSNIVGSRTLIYSTSATGGGGATIRSGKLGWILSGQPDPAAAGTVQVTLCPAFWEMGASDLRLMAGQEPYQFHFFDVGRVHFTMQSGQFCVLGPDRVVEDQDTLDRILFDVPQRNKICFFVIVYGGKQQIESH